jgi:hypothetical protein
LFIILIPNQHNKKLYFLMVAIFFDQQLINS